MPSPGTHDGPPWVIINDKKITAEYWCIIEEDRVLFQLGAILSALGGKQTESPYNTSYSECIELNGRKYVIDNPRQLFILEEDMAELERLFSKEGRSLTIESAEPYNLFPCMHEGEDYYLKWNDTRERASVMIDHQTLIDALAKTGFYITVDWDINEQTVTITRNGTQD